MLLAAGPGAMRHRGRPDTKIAKPGSRGVSGGAGGAAVGLDAVLAQQVAEAIELAVDSLVLRDDGPDVDAGPPLVLQPQFLGSQLLFPFAQRRGGLKVTRVERGPQLPPHLAELIGGVGKVAGDGRRTSCSLGSACSPLPVSRLSARSRAWA